MIRFASISREGSRPENEDSVGAVKDGNGYCFALADGLGGHGCGEVASALAVQTAKEEFARGESDFLERVFVKAQENILTEQSENRRHADMKTTLVVLTVGEESIRWGHIGDSRLYYFKNGRILERTLDHSVPQMLATGSQSSHFTKGTFFPVIFSTRLTASSLEFMRLSATTIS